MFTAADLARSPIPPRHVPKLMEWLRFHPEYALTGDRGEREVEAVHPALPGTFEDIQNEGGTRIYPTEPTAPDIRSDNPADAGLRVVLWGTIRKEGFPTQTRWAYVVFQLVDGAPAIPLVDLITGQPISNPEFLYCNDLIADPSTGVVPAGLVTVDIQGNTQLVMQGSTGGQDNLKIGFAGSSHRGVPSDFLGLVQGFRYGWPSTNNVDIRCDVHYPNGGGVNVRPVGLRMDSLWSGGDKATSIVLDPNTSTWCFGRRDSGSAVPYTLWYTFAWYRIALR